MNGLLILSVIQLAALAAPPPIVYETFKSAPVRLRSGQIANTRDSDYPLKFPQGPIAVQYFVSRVVDDNGQNVSVEELYIHHYLIYNGGSNGGLCPNLHNIWGVGAEMVNVVYSYTYPYAVILTGKESWTANLHFIRTTNVPASDVQDCIECRCEDSNPPLHPHGDVNCCIDQSQCWGMENSTIMDFKNYYLEYTVGYVPVTPELIPLTIFSLDVTSTSTTDCQVNYDIPALGPNETHVIYSDNLIPSDWNISYIENHLHIGGLQLTVDHYRGGSKIGPVCSSAPVYIEKGEGVGHLVDIPPCLFPTNPYQVKAGDFLRITSTYGPRTLPGGNPWHAGVMGLIYVAAAAHPDAHDTCLVQLHYFCGAPIYPSGAQCLACASDPRVAQALEQAGCTVDWVKAECAKNNDGGNIPAPDEVHNMSLHVLPDQSQPNVYNFNFNCPVGAWCSIAANLAGDALMENSSAFVYSTNGSTMAFQERTLGNHNSGVVVNPKYPATITTKGSNVNFLFSVHAVITGNQKRICFLFAQGAPGTTDFGYHGATRGYSCLEIHQLRKH